MKEQLARAAQAAIIEAESLIIRCRAEGIVLKPTGRCPLRPLCDEMAAGLIDAHPAPDIGEPDHAALASAARRALVDGRKLIFDCMALDIDLDISGICPFVGKCAATRPAP